MSYVCQVLAVREEEWRRDQGRWFRWGLVTCEPVTGSFTMNVGLSTPGQTTSQRHNSELAELEFSRRGKKKKEKNNHAS